MADIEVTDVPGGSRYEAHDNGELVGVLAYHRTPGMVIFDHTEVEPPARGRGIASALSAVAIADAQEDNVRVVPTCSYVRRWIEGHPEYLPLLAARPHS